MQSRQNLPGATGGGGATIADREGGAQSVSRNRPKDTRNHNGEQKFQNTPNHTQKPAALQFASQTASRSNMTLNQSVNNGNRNQRLMSSFDKKNTQQSVQNALNGTSSQGLIPGQVAMPKGGGTQV